MKVLTAEQMMAFDRWAIDEVGIPEAVLIENAAIAVTDAIFHRARDPRSCCVVCCPGNNGADGFAVARQLLTRGVAVTCFYLGKSDSADTDQAEQQRRSFRLLGGRVKPLAEDDCINAEFDAALADCDVVVDALFGTGLSRPLEGVALTAVSKINATREEVQFAPQGNGKNRLTLSVDLPSGLSASSGALLRSQDGDGPEPVKADLTVSFARPKIAHAAFPGADFCGEVVVADLGLPYRTMGPEPWANTNDLETVARLLRPRDAQGHKGTFGRCLVIAGSEGLQGAAELSVLGCLRGGVGLVTLASPGSLEVGPRLPLEAMTKSVGGGACKFFEESHLEEVVDAIDGRNSAVLGPGIGRVSSTKAFGCRLLSKLEELAIASVVDADGLSSMVGVSPAVSSALSSEGGPGLTADEASVLRVLTPHPGELSRLLKLPIEEIESDRLGAARIAATRFQSIVVLKGHCTVVAEPDGEAWLNITGGPLLAAGGSGDVLAGLIGGLLAQGYSALDAALIGVFVHGLAADLLTDERSRLGLGASAIANKIPDALEACYRFQEDEAQTVLDV